MVERAGARFFLPDSGQEPSPMSNPKVFHQMPTNGAITV
jgi:hypothetical protein